MINKINVWPIVCEHFRTLKDAQSKRYLKRDIIGFYALPFVGGFLTSYLYGNIQQIDTGLLCYTILIPLLVNILFLIYSILSRNSSVSKNEKYIRILKQLYSNLSYTIVVSTFSLLILLVYSAIEKHKYIAFIFSSILYFLFYHIVLTSLMIIKRLHVLLQKEIKQEGAEQ